MDKLIEVMQADRNAAAEWCAGQPFPSKQAEAPMIAKGEYDHHSLVQAFARHRIAERAAIVAWLREQPSLIPASPDHVRQNSPKHLADAIERGDHAGKVEK